ncbi:MAG: RNA polymerase sigma factor [Chloracidobacterium sp.]
MPNLSPPPDADIVKLVLSGEVEAFRWLVERYQRRVFNLAYRMVGRLSDAEDITQDVFLRLYEYLPRYDPGLPLENWLVRIASNYTLNWLGKQRLRRSASLDDEAHWRRLADAEPPMVERLAQRERQRQVLAALQALPIDQRLVVILKYLDDYSIDEIALTLGAPKNTIRTWLARARETLRGKLQASGDLTLE